MKRALNFVTNWWGVVAFSLIACLVYLQAVSHKKEQIAKLEKNIEQLQTVKITALEEQEELNAKLKSLDDPSYIEMTLKKELGLVPEDARKVYFSE